MISVRSAESYSLPCSAASSRIQTESVTLNRQGWNDRWRESEGMCRRPDDTSKCRSSFSTHNSLNLSGRSVNLITQMSHVVVPVQH